MQSLRTMLGYYLVTESIIKYLDIQYMGIYILHNTLHSAISKQCEKHGQKSGLPPFVCKYPPPLRKKALSTLPGCDLIFLKFGYFMARGDFQQVDHSCRQSRDIS